MNDAPLDIEQPVDLIAYLRRTGRIGGYETPAIRVLAGGVSNRTVLVERDSGEAWVLKQALAKLRVAVDWFSDPARIGREALGIQWLAELAPVGTITPLVFEDPNEFLLAMRAVPSPHENFKTVLLRGEIRQEHIAQFGRLLGTIHRNSWDRRQELHRLFSDRTFFETLRLEPYYHYTAEQVPAAATFLRDLIRSTLLRRFSIVHGDYSPKNVLIRGGLLVLLDHEVIHFGDPSFDLGFSLAHFLSKAHHLKSHRDAFAGAALTHWREYRAALGDVPWADDLEQHAVRQTLGCLLARVAGRSTLEYLDTDERARQQDAAVAMMQKPVATVDAMVWDFLDRV